MILMKNRVALRASVLTGTGVILGLLLGAAFSGPNHTVETRAFAEGKPSGVTEVTNANLVPGVKEVLPDQSHAMADVGYHFANLWFAADKENWPLAKYYLEETRSHLNWAVRLHPVRTTKAGSQVDLKGILQAIDNSFLSEIDTAITNKDASAFKTAYQQTLEGCYACHKACEKPFLRPQIPAAPGVSILNFDPNAAWPQ
jgi:hypothetical protein